MRHAERHQRQQAGGQAQRQRRHDRQRVDEAVELRRQHHVDEDDREHQRDGEVARRFRERARAAAEHRLVAGLEVQLLDLDPRVGQHLAERHALQVGVDRDLPLAVVAIDRRRAEVALELRDVADLDHLAAVPAATSRSPIVGGRPERLVEPQQHLELVVAVLELRHFLAADQRAQVVGERVDVDAEVSRARAVDVDSQLGLGRLEVGVDVDDARDGADRDPSAGRCTAAAARCPVPE